MFRESVARFRANTKAISDKRPATKVLDSKVSVKMFKAKVSKKKALPSKGGRMLTANVEINGEVYTKKQFVPSHVMTKREKLMKALNKK